MLINADKIVAQPPDDGHIYLLNGDLSTRR